MFLMKISLNFKISRIFQKPLCLLVLFFAHQMAAMQSEIVRQALEKRKTRPFIPFTTSNPYKTPSEKINPLELKQSGASIVKTQFGDSFLICEEKNIDNCIRVKRDILNLCNSIKGLLEDFEENKTENMHFTPIPINYPIADIKNSFDIITVYSEPKELGDKIIAVKNSLQKYSLEDLIGIENFVDAFDGPFDISHTCFDAIKDHILSMKNTFSNLSLDKLRPNLQESLFTLKSINQLKKLIIKKYQITRKTELGIQSSEQTPGQTRWSPDGSKICTVQPSLINIWDIERKEKIELQSYHSHEHVSAAMFSPDNKKIAFVAGHTIQVWDINKKNSNHPIATLSWRFVLPKLVFTEEGTILFAQSSGDRLYGWDFMNKTYAMPQQFIVSSHFHHINTIVLNPAKKTTIAVGGQANHNNILALCDISRLTNITVLKEGIFKNPIAPIAFSQNGKMIVSRPLNTSDQLIINNVDNDIFNEDTSLKLDSKEIGKLPAIESAEFLPDNDFIIASVVPNVNDYKNSKLILWDISDPKKPSYEILDSGFGVSVAPSSDGSCKIAFSTMDLANVALVRVWTLWTAQDLNSINSLKSCTSDQKRLVYDICFKSLLSLNKDQTKAFLTLPIELQELLIDLLDDKLSLSTYKTIPKKFLLPDELKKIKESEPKQSKENWFWNWLKSYLGYRPSNT